MVRGDASVQYLYSKTAAAEMAADVPHARILICLREPVDFVRSYHNQMLTNLDEDRPLRDAWDASEQGRDVAREPSMLDYKAVGLFSEQIDRYRAVFSDEQIRILRLRDFIADPRRSYLSLLGWLGLPDDGRMDFPAVHKAVSPKSRSLARLLKSPPPLIRSSAQAIKRVAGVGSLGLARRLRNFNTAESYAAPGLDAELVVEIADRYAADQRALQRHGDLLLLRWADAHA